MDRYVNIFGTCLQQWRKDPALLEIPIQLTLLCCSQRLDCINQTNSKNSQWNNPKLRWFKVLVVSTFLCWVCVINSQPPKLLRLKTGTNQQSNQNTANEIWQSQWKAIQSYIILWYPHLFLSLCHRLGYSQSFGMEQWKRSKDPYKNHIQVTQGLE